MAMMLSFFLLVCLESKLIFSISRQLKAFQIHVQQVLALQKSVPNGKSHNTFSGNEQDSFHSAESNSVYSMVSRLLGATDMVVDC